MVIASGIKNRGFGKMVREDPERQKEIARAGGRASGGNFAKNRKRASAAGKIGGSR